MPTVTLTEEQLLNAPPCCWITGRTDGLERHEVVLKQVVGWQIAAMAVTLFTCSPVIPGFLWLTLPKGYDANLYVHPDAWRAWRRSKGLLGVAVVLGAVIQTFGFWDPDNRAYWLTPVAALPVVFAWLLNRGRWPSVLRQTDGKLEVFVPSEAAAAALSAKA